MGHFFRPSALVPQGFVAESIENDGAVVRIVIHAKSSVGCCPGCGRMSTRVHSRYPRRLADLPLSGRSVQLILMARRFHCDAVLCGRRIFTERGGRAFSHLGHDGRRASITSFIISALRWEDGRRQALRVA